MNMVYSFIKSHIRCKTIVFLSSCKQARFAFEAMRRVRPGVSVMALHGKQKPKKRSLVYMTFVRHLAAMCFILFPCTDALASCSWRKRRQFYLPLTSPLGVLIFPM